MGDRRKLNGEIDRCLKKVNEGVETFDDIWQKVHSAPNPNQKDRYEQELKKEIKKLQRLRDQIKGWLASADVKDKKLLQDARKNIEQQMERFKVVERETKTKAYSKEGLGAGQKLDPQEKEKEECTQWITDAINELKIQIYKFEAEAESLQSSLKKKKSDRDKQERLEDTKRSIERHNYHIKALEKILRAIDNDALDTKEIQSLRTEVEYYVESNQEADFKENESMYEDIDLDNLATILGPVIAVPTTQHHPPAQPNGATGSLPSNTTALMDMTASALNTYSHAPTANLLERAMTSTSASNSNYGDTDSNVGLTTPSSTQPSSPNPSPALSLTDDGKRNKSESDDHHSQRNRSNSGANGSSTPSISHSNSPKIPLLHQTSSGTSTLTKMPSSSFTSNQSHATYSAVATSSSAVASTTTTTAATTTPHILPYSTIVSQNTSPLLSSSSSTTTASTSNSNLKILVQPQSKVIPKLHPYSSNDSTVNINSTQSVSTVTPPISNQNLNSSHLSPLVANNDRNGQLNQQILKNIAQISGAQSTATVTLVNGSKVPVSLYTTSGPSPNIPHELASNSSHESTMSTQKSTLFSYSTSDNDRSPNLIGNGSPDGPSLLDSNSLTSLSPINTTSSSYLSTNNTLADLAASNNNPIGQLSDQHSYRYLIPPSNQQSMQTTRMPLTAAETRMLNRLNSAYAKLPSLLESERQRTNANRIYGRNQLGQLPVIPHYPQTPPTSSDTPEFYNRLAPDTLFFVFYYMEGTRAQYLAAKALKRQSWRFHTKLMMWFQRHEEPKSITDDYEQGTYIYFDYERWQTRRRENFTFEYKFLEDREF